jgi:hypothetical protein
MGQYRSVMVGTAIVNRRGRFRERIDEGDFANESTRAISLPLYRLAPIVDQ